MVEVKSLDRTLRTLDWSFVRGVGVEVHLKAPVLGQLGAVYAKRPDFRCPVGRSVTSVAAGGSQGRSIDLMRLPMSGR